MTKSLSLGELLVKIKTMVIAVFVLSVSMQVAAAPTTFNFNSITMTSNTTTDGLNGGANSAAITNYMNGVLFGSGITVNVTGALATRNYTADGSVIPGNPTLGTSDHATSYNDLTHPSNPTTANPDVFILNDHIPIFGSASDSIVMTFSSLPLGTLQVGFDWEIFADNSCAPCNQFLSGNQLNPNFPDLDFLLDGSPVQTFYALPSNQLSPSGSFPQNLGTAIINLNITTAGPHTLTFMDWPAEIGIDNLSLESCTGAQGCIGRVPEPSPLSLAALALALLALVRWGPRRPAIAS
jgi:hypothetical protein